MSKNLVSEKEELKRNKIIKGCIIQIGHKILIIHTEH